MKMYEPELNLGDVVWIMSNNKPTETKINKIEVWCHSTPSGYPIFSCRYTVTEGHTLLESTPDCPGDFIFTTKEDLIKHLLNEN